MKRKKFPDKGNILPHLISYGQGCVKT